MARDEDDDLIGTGDGRKASRKDNERASPDDIAGDQLLSIIERVERLEEEKKGVSDDIKEVYAEAKANGYDTKVLRQVVKMRKQDAAERQEFEAVLDLYMSAIGLS